MKVSNVFSAILKIETAARLARARLKIGDDPQEVALELRGHVSPVVSDPVEVEKDAKEAVCSLNYAGHNIAFAGKILQHACHGASAAAGWWQDPKTGQDLKAELQSGSMFGAALAAQKLCLIHSEVSEAMEGHRKGLPDDKLPHRPMMEVELADAVIRIFDLAGAMDYDLGGAIAEKMAYNAQRADHKLENRAAAGGKTY